MDFLSILIAFYLGKYNDKITAYLNNFICNLFKKKENNKEDFYDGELKEKDLIKEGVKDDKETNKKTFIWD